MRSWSPYTERIVLGHGATGRHADRLPTTGVGGADGAPATFELRGHDLGPTDGSGAFLVSYFSEADARQTYAATACFAVLDSCAPARGVALVGAPVGHWKASSAGEARSGSSSSSSFSNPGIVPRCYRQLIGAALVLEVSADASTDRIRGETILLIVEDAQLEQARTVWNHSASPAWEPLKPGREKGSSLSSGSSS